jgi:hypothetical protein
MSKGFKITILSILILATLGIVALELTPAQVQTPQNKYPRQLTISDERYPGESMTVVLPKDFNEARAAGCIYKLLQVYDPDKMGFEARANLARWCIEHYDEVKYFTNN